MKLSCHVLCFLLCGVLPLSHAVAQEYDDDIRPGATRTEAYLPLLEGKRVGLVVNHTAMVDTAHLVDTLLRAGVDVKKIFAPEHGFRGVLDAGESVSDSRDAQTELPVISLYGPHKKPRSEALEDVDLLLFDIQDVGVRFYTYISTMHYVMEACAEHDIPLLILDRPNPNGHYVDGPVLDTNFSSFVGMHPVPVVHGMTVAEYARMINGEGWLEGGRTCSLEYVTCANYDHTKFYKLPKRPSPNLPNMRAVYLYPSLCFFEGTIMSVGRGTEMPFQVIGHPDYTKGNDCFMPLSRPGAQFPKHHSKMCCGYNLTHIDIKHLRTQGINLRWLQETHRFFHSKRITYFNDFFDKLAGSERLREQVNNYWEAEKIIQSWQADLKAFKETRRKYLLYADFE